MSIIFLTSNAEQIAKVSGMTFEGYAKKRILKPERYDLLWKVHHDTGYGSVGPSWFIMEYKGHRTTGHSGGDVGYTSNLVMLPDDSIAVVAMCNEIPSDVLGFRLLAYAHYRGGDFDAATEALMQALEINPDSEDLKKNRLRGLKQSRWQTHASGEALHLLL